MASSLQSSGGGVDVGAIVRSYYRHSSDFESPSGADFGGFVLETARLYAEGSYTSFDWRFSFGFTEGPFEEDTAASGDTIVGSGLVPIDSPPVDQDLEAELLDAYARWNLTESFSIQFGHINPRDSFTGDVRPDRLLFPQRTLLGEQFHQWDLGVQFEGSYGAQEAPDLEWSFAVLNGDDGAQDDMNLRARVDFHTLGTGAGNVEGAYDPEGSPGGTLGIFWSQDDDVAGTDGQPSGVGGTILGADYHANYGKFSLIGEYAYFDRDASEAAGLGDDESNYFSVSGAVLLGDSGGFELAGRYEDFDSLDSRDRITVGLNYYIPETDVKAQLAWVSQGSDDATRDGDVFQLGLSAALSTARR
ncbi:MAG: porin [Planctomycetota bacterium]